MRSLGVLILRAWSATASAERTCSPLDFYAMVGPRGSSFSNRSGSGAVLGAGYEGPGTSVLVVVVTVVGGLLLYVSSSGE